MLITPLGHRIAVRFARKPIWMPTAPSKLFRVPEHKFYSEAEVNQIRILQSAYKAQVASIQQLMREEFYIPSTQTGGLPAEFLKRDEDTHLEALEENARENDIVGKEREEFLKKRLDVLEESLLKRKETREETIVRETEKIDRFVAGFDPDQYGIVTPENFDQKIEMALKQPTNYEFFIDKNGNVFGKPKRDLVPGPNNPLELEEEANDAKQA